MSEFEDKLNSILGNPEAMAQVLNLAQSLNLGGGGGEQEGAPPPPDQGAPPPGGGGLGDLLGQLDPKLMERLLPLAGELAGGGSGSDERLALLYALRPFLKPERRDKVERAVKVARLIHVGKKLLAGLGESGDV